MIRCTPYNAWFLTPVTCIKHQEKLAELKRRKPKKYIGMSQVHYGTETTEYYKISRCDGCKTGERLYAKAVVALMSKNRSKNGNRPEAA